MINPKEFSSNTHGASWTKHTHTHTYTREQSICLNHVSFLPAAAFIFKNKEWNTRNIEYILRIGRLYSNGIASWPRAFVLWIDDCMNKWIAHREMNKSSLFWNYWPRWLCFLSTHCSVNHRQVSFGLATMSINFEFIHLITSWHIQQ